MSNEESIDAFRVKISFFDPTTEEIEEFYLEKLPRIIQELNNTKIEMFIGTATVILALIIKHCEENMTNFDVHEFFDMIKSISLMHETFSILSQSWKI